MEVISDELKKNGVNADLETLSERLTREELLLNVFHKMNVNSLGRAMAYLTLVYRMSHIIKEDTARQAIRLTVPVIRNTGIVEEGFIRKLCSWDRSWVLNLWDLM